MSSAFALSLLLCSVGPAQRTEIDNLDFRSGTLSGWEKHGTAFYVTTADGRGPSLAAGVCSSDRGTPGRTGLLRKVFVVPAGAGLIRFQAFAVCRGAGKNWAGSGQLNVLLATPGKQIIPKRVLTGDGWQPAPLVLLRLKGRPRDYSWDVTGYVGRTVQIVIGDDNKRPGCHVFCSGFRILPPDQTQALTFARFMVRLADKHQMAPPVRYDSQHFTAVSNADDNFTRLRLNNCELIYGLFFKHFQEKGLPLQTPSTKLMVAIFDSQGGFEAYLGQKMSPLITGMYHPKTNRLVVYDYGRNDAFVAYTRDAIQRGKAYGGRIDQRRYVETVARQASEFRTGTNIGTTMHEVAHQLSFNGGLLNRQGDVPAWLAEGLACYCEATENGTWLGIGEPNPGRLKHLAKVLHNRGQLYHLQDLLKADTWCRGRDGQTILTGYAQSWALFRYLMERQPRTMARYLQQIYTRRARDHRLTDFRQAFGADLNRLELRYLAYLKQMVQEYKAREAATR